MKQKIDSAILLALLKRQYPAHCSETAPFAFWKMKALIEDGDAYCIPGCGCHYLIRDNHLLYYSAPDGRCHIPLSELNALSAISLAAKIYDQIKHDLAGFEVNYGWGLRYDPAHRRMETDFTGYEAVDFDFGNEAHYDRAAKIIAQDENSSGEWMNAARVRRMTAFSAFAPSLWFFVRDKASGKLIAISISAYSREVRETDLDWIFVLSEYQGKGAGRFLIEETIRRCRDRSNVIRVGGTADFYRKCGFVNDVLWVWAVKPGYRFTCETIQP